MKRRATEPGKRYPAFSPDGKRSIWLSAGTFVFCAALCGVLWYLKLVGDKNTAVLIVISVMAVVLPYLLVHRIRAHLDPITIESSGFRWRGSVHSWSSLDSVNEREMSNGLYSVDIQFLHNGTSLVRSIWLHEKQAYVLAAELRSLRDA
ncbi:MAG: hypothetical protein R3E76_10685 [Planctomycetota bacterium]